jgi:uncharacterized protein (TIGR00730 family)
VGGVRLVSEPPGREPPAADQVRAGIEALRRLAALPNAVDDLKLAASAVAEIEQAARVFGSGPDRRRVGFFGSSRVPPGDPLYEQARLFGELMTARGWMVITGAGPGLMHAANAGAGIEGGYGVNIALRSAAKANEFVDPARHVVHKYFFLRKLTLVRASAGFVVMPGGFGTADEAFELLTLAQMGKMPPAPIVLLDQPGGCYWTAFVDFARQAMVEAGYVREDSLALFRVTDSAPAAVAEIVGFYANYQCLHWTGERRLVLHLRYGPPRAALDDLCTRYSDLAGEGIASGSEHPVDCDVRDPATLSLLVTARRFGRLRQLIDELNTADWLPEAG